MKYPKSFFELIDSENFRKKVPMFIRKRSISNFQMFMSGYEFCESNYNLKPVDTDPPFWLFYHWIRKKYNYSGSYHNWDGIILQNCDNDETRALDRFFDDFDQFRKFAPNKIFQCQITEKEIQFYQSKKEVDKANHGIDSNGTTATKLMIIEYNNDFGSTCHRISIEKSSSAYFDTTQLAIKDIERDYGSTLIWEEITAFDLDKIHAGIKQNN